MAGSEGRGLFAKAPRDVPNLGSEEMLHHPMPVMEDQLHVGSIRIE
jgi:hypothetical protein